VGCEALEDTAPGGHDTRLGKGFDAGACPPAVDYQRAYWLLFVGCGVLLALGELPALLAGRVSLGSGLSILVGGVVAVGGAYALGSGETRGAPESLDLRFGMVLVAFLLLVGTTLVAFL
jgi:hypothetical protein